MMCPRCGPVPLTERERDGIVVDLCPQCRGVWLDRGELERLQARAVQELEQAEAGRTRPESARARPEGGPAPFPAQPEAAREPHSHWRRDDEDDRDDDDDGHHHRRPDGRNDPHQDRGAPPPRRRSWMSVFDLFD